MATPYLKIHHQPVGATCGRPFLVLPQKDMETLCYDEVFFSFYLFQKKEG